MDYLNYKMRTVAVPKTKSGVRFGKVEQEGYAAILNRDAPLIPQIECIACELVYRQIEMRELCLSTEYHDALLKEIIDSSYVFPYDNRGVQQATVFGSFEVKTVGDWSYIIGMQGMGLCPVLVILHFFVGQAFERDETCKEAVIPEAVQENLQTTKEDALKTLRVKAQRAAQWKAGNKLSVTPA